MAQHAVPASAGRRLRRLRRLAELAGPSAGSAWIGIPWGVPR